MIKPVYFTSKALTETQKGYIAIELEYIGGGMGHGKIPPFHIWHPLYPRDGSETTRSNTFKEFEPCNTTIAEKLHLNISIPFYSVPYSRNNQSIS